LFELLPFRALIFTGVEELLDIREKFGETPDRLPAERSVFLFRKIWTLIAIVLVPLAGHCQRLTPLAPNPDWSELERFQGTITHDQFTQLLSTVYAPEGTGPWITLEPEQAVIQKDAKESFILHFALNQSALRPAPHYWSLARFGATAEKPLTGLRIALDPGHLGGAWAKMEERWFQIGSSLPVTEGDMVLRVAKLLGPQLTELGAQLDFVRSTPDPATGKRPDSLMGEAHALLQNRGISQPARTYAGPADPAKETAIPWVAEMLFYRVAEIRARAQIVNNQIKPDLTICLHFNAEPWGDPTHPALVKINHLHLLINGAYSPSELGYDDVRFSMLFKLLNRSFEPELAISEAIAQSMAEATHLPPYLYTTSNAKPVGKTGYVWARNLMANRLYQCPVVYVEPYVMNSEEVFARVQAGEYKGLREFGGILKKNIYAEYADAVTDGLKKWAMECDKAL
jgi:hypothetical protein